MRDVAFSRSMQERYHSMRGAFAVHHRTRLAAAALTVTWAAAVQAQAKAPTTAVAHPVAQTTVAQSKTPPSLAAPGSSSAAVLPTRNYKLSMLFTDVNGASETQGAMATLHVTHSGLTLSLGTAQADLSGIVSGTHVSLTGSRSISNVGNVTVTLDGTATTDGATGSVSVTAPGQHATGTFSLAPYPMVGALSCGNLPVTSCEKIVSAALDVLSF